MAKFSGITCDGCGAVLQEKDVHKSRTRITGPEVSGEFSKDLCSQCIRDPGKGGVSSEVTLSRLRGRKAGVTPKRGRPAKTEAAA